MEHKPRFTTLFPLEKRQAESARIIQKYPDRMPIIVEPCEMNSSTPVIQKTKYLVPKNFTVAELLKVIRKQIPALTAEEALFVCVIMPDKTIEMPPITENISTIYATAKHEDGFMYFNYTKQVTFG